MTKKVMTNKKLEGTTATVIPLMVLTILTIAALVYFYNIRQISLYNITTAGTTTVTNPTTVAQVTTIQTSQLYDYALFLINNDRQQYGLQPVTLSGTTSGQQHADSMMGNNYFSHWDFFGLKPYMRYTLLDGMEAVSENIATKYSKVCSFGVCSGDINAESALQMMEHEMMYNDSACCNNGHRDNILDPRHNQVSIGIAYNSSTIYFVEDFVDSYIDWSNNGINYANNEASLSGSVQNGYSFSSLLISYDPPVVSMSQSELMRTSAYDYGAQVAGVVSNPIYYYTNVETIVADHYNTNGNAFSVSFSMQKLISRYGAGEYTILVWLDDTAGNSFVGATHTIFIGPDGLAFTPSNV